MDVKLGEKEPQPSSSTYTLLQRSDSSSTSSASLEPSPPLTAQQQLSRYLIEIIGFSFSVDPHQLALALDTSVNEKEKAGKISSILSSHEQQHLLNLSQLVNHLHKKITHNDINTTYRHDRDCLNKLIISPAESMGICGSWALDIIATFADHRCDPAKRAYTSIARSTLARRFFFRLRLPQAALAAELVCHARIIRIVAPNEEVQHLLGMGLQGYQKRYFKGPLNVRYSQWPSRLGFWDLRTACCGAGGSGKFELVKGSEDKESALL